MYIFYSLRGIIMNKKIVIALAILFTEYVFTKNSIAESVIAVIPEAFTKDIIKDSEAKSEAKVESKNVKDELVTEKMVKPLIKPEVIVNK